MSKIGEKISVKFMAWVDKKARMYAGTRCLRQYHQPVVPMILRKEK